MAELTDLDKVLGTRIKVIFKGVEYEITTDVVVGRVLKLLRDSAEVSVPGASPIDQVAQMEKTFNLIVEVFKMSGHEEITLEYIMENMTWKQGMKLLENVRNAVMQTDETKKSP